MNVAAVSERLPEYLARQRWFAGGEPDKVTVLHDEHLAGRLAWVIVDADGARYQLMLGAADAKNAPDFLHGHDAETLGEVDGQVVFDGLLDPELAAVVLQRVVPGEDGRRMRPMGVEQSNTSVVFDDRVVLKVFRRLHDGPNPDVEVTTGLASAGFENVAAPSGVWREDGTDLAIVQPYLGGGTEGWSLALTSIRDLFGNDCDDPADCGGDFAGEAVRLGEVTARMHLALAQAFGAESADVGAWLDVMRTQVTRVGNRARWRADAMKIFDGVSSLEGGSAIRVHGDFHLGQVLRTDLGWYVLDFEGEPARPLEERRQHSSPLKDVAGMLRSFHYATAVGLNEWPPEDRDRFIAQAGAWEERNRGAFLKGYLGTDGIGAVLPPDVWETTSLLTVWELDKAIYEIGYEKAHRPDWVSIPQAAVERLVLAANG